MNVLSLFDGMSCGQIALNKLGIDYDKYFACEIDKYAMQVTQHNFPDTIQLGDVTKVNAKTLYLLEVYDYICKKYFNNDLQSLQSIIPEWQMLHRINEEQSFAAYFGTQIQGEDEEASANTSLSINDRVWFFRNPMGDTDGVYDIIRSGSRGGKTNFNIKELCKHSFWWNGYGQSKSRVKEESVEWIKGEESQRINERKTKGVCDKTILNQGSSGTSKENVNTTTSRPNKEEKLSRREGKNGHGISKEEEVSYREKEKGGKVHYYEENVQANHEANRISEIDWIQLRIYKEIQVTIIECEWGIIIFKGTIGLTQGGSPCQGFSFAGKQLNFEDPRSALFFEYVRLVKELKPKYFLLENVVMKNEYQDVITETLFITASGNDWERID